MNGRPSVTKPYKIWGLEIALYACGSQVVAVHTITYDPQELQRPRMYLYSFVRAEFKVQLSGLPGSPGELSHINLGK